ncbi:MAG: hypothetical protein ACI9J4_001584 [Paraglaciecola sp.]|jgi:hypothetical protein
MQTSFEYYFFYDDDDDERAHLDNLNLSHTWMLERDRFCFTWVVMG